MLGDRDYMRNRNPRGRGFVPSVQGLYALYGLIGINLLFLMVGGNRVDLMLSLAGIRSGEYWQLVSSLFLHQDFFHFFFNMFSLYIFGSMVAPILGPKRFLILYFTAGIVGNLCWLGTATQTESGFLLGASGAVMGVIIAAAMMLPDVPMLLLFIPFPMKLKTMAVVFICIELFNQYFNSGVSNVAYIAHIGGFLGGMLLMHFFYRQFVSWDPVSFLGTGRILRNQNVPPRTPPPGWTVRDDRYAPPPPPPSGRVTQKEMDHLLDKLSRGGINSLSEAELARLRQAREQMKQDRERR